MLKSLRRCKTITGQYENDSTSSLWRSCICNRSLYIFLLSERLYAMVLNAISITISSLTFEKGKFVYSRYKPQLPSNMMCKRALGFQTSLKFCVYKVCHLECLQHSDSPEVLYPTGVIVWNVAMIFRCGGRSARVSWLWGLWFNNKTMVLFMWRLRINQNNQKYWHPNPPW